MKAQAVFCGKVTRVAQFTTKTGKPALSVSLDGTPEQWGDKTFVPRVEAITYLDVARLATLRNDTWVIITGNAEAKTYESNGKTNANLTITGTISPLFPTTDRPPPSPVVAPAPGAAAPTSTPDKPKADDDLPF